MKAETHNLPAINKAAEWANQAAKEKRWAVAAQRWAVLRKAYPEQAIVWLQAAKAHIKAGEFDLADALLSHGRLHFSNNPNAYIISAELAIQRQHWDSAETLLQYTREKFPEFAQTWITSADSQECQGQIDKAIIYNRHAREKFPDVIAAFIQYAEIAMRTEQWADALTRWQLVRKHFPDANIGYQRAALAAQKLGNKRLARQLLLEQEYGENELEQENSSATQLPERKNRPKSIHLLELIWTKAIFNLRSEAYRNYLSYAWLVLEPLLHILVFYIIFSVLLHRGGDNFLVFLFAGQIPWIWFSKSVSGSSASIIAGKNLMLQVGLAPIIFPLINLLKISLQHIPVFLMLFGFICLQGFLPNIYWWFLIPVIFVQLLLTAACTCFVAAVIPFARDLNYLVHTGLMFLMFGSGIFYDYKTLAVEWQEVFLLNPIAFLLNSYRDILIYNSAPDLIALAAWAGISLLGCLLMLVVYAKLRYIYPKIVME